MNLEKITKKLSKVYGPKRAKILEKQYRNYLFLRWKYKEILLPPSIEIDEYWHEHILNTQKYHDDCEEIFGYYLHHEPNHGLSESEITRMFQENTQELYFEEYGQYILAIRKLNILEKFHEIFKKFVFKKS